MKSQDLKNPICSSSQKSRFEERNTESIDEDSRIRRIRSLVTLLLITPTFEQPVVSSPHPVYHT
jgi:hypothetical protein